MKKFFFASYFARWLLFESVRVCGHLCKLQILFGGVLRKVVRTSVNLFKEVPMGITVARLINNTSKFIMMNAFHARPSECAVVSKQMV